MTKSTGKGYSGESEAVAFAHERNPDRFRWHSASAIHGPNERRTIEGGNSGKNLIAEETGQVVQLVAEDESPAETLTSALALARAGREFAIVTSEQRGAWPSEPSRSKLASGCFQCMTSGSSGTGKRVRRTQRSWIASFSVNQQRWSIGSEDRYAVLGELSSSLSLYGALEAVHLGADLHMLSGMNPGAQNRELYDRKITVIYATPTLLRLLAEDGEKRHRQPVASARLVLVGGSKLDSGTLASTLRLFPQAAVHEFYGSAETSFVTLGDGGSEVESVGLPYPGVKIRIGSNLQQGRTGEVWVQSPYLFEGYAGTRNGPARWDGDHLSVGEAGWLDGSGRLHLAGRMDRMVKIADKIVHPEEAERFLSNQQGVRNAAVLVEPDPLRGNRLVGMINDAGGAVDLDRLLQLCRAELGPHNSPVRIVRREGWPLVPSGKTDLASLAEELKAERN